IVKDDANEIIEKMIHTDIWIFATPVYFCSLSAQMKTLIDRMFAREYEIREMSRRKKAYLILTSGSTCQVDMVGAVESFRGFIKVLRTVDEADIIYGLGAFEMNDAKNHIAYQKAYELGKNITL
ncbi:MAG: NAD(P)H-dependent oxidoreductase, partial [Coprobacillus sp.]